MVVQEPATASEAVRTSTPKRSSSGVHSWSRIGRRGSPVHRQETVGGDFEEQIAAVEGGDQSVVAVHVLPEDEGPEVVCMCSGEEETAEVGHDVGLDDDLLS
jgi:hypothetical protein